MSDEASPAIPLQCVVLKKDIRAHPDWKAFSDYWVLRLPGATEDSHIRVEIIAARPDWLRGDGDDGLTLYSYFALNIVVVASEPPRGNELLATTVSATWSPYTLAKAWFLLRNDAAYAADQLKHQILAVTGRAQDAVKRMGDPYAS